MPEFAPLDLSRWSAGRWSALPAAPLRGVAIDTRALHPGDLFVALAGAASDGHQHLDAALAAGAAGALVRRGTRHATLPLLEVDEPRLALGWLAAGYRAGHAACRIGVTGSTGKTTVKEMLADILATQAPTARTRGNWNNDLGLPLSLLGMEPEDRYGVFEVGMSKPGELAPLCEILQPQASIITSVGPVHIEFFEDEAAIAREKATVAIAVPPGGWVVLPADDRWFDVLRAQVRGRVVTTSLSHPADYRAEQGAGLDFCVVEKATGERVECQAPFPGDFVVHDALLAMALGRRLGVPWEPMIRAIAAYRPVGMRWQRESVGGMLVINDAYNANPMSMRAALRAFARTEVAGARWLVLGSMRELGAHAEAEHLALGRELAQGSWAGLLALGREGAWLAEGARAAGWPEERACWCSDTAEAARWLASRVRPGDAVLLKASRGERLEDVLLAWRGLRGEG